MTVVQEDLFASGERRGVDESRSESSGGFARELVVAFDLFGEERVHPRTHVELRQRELVGPEGHRADHDVDPARAAQLDHALETRPESLHASRISQVALRLLRRRSILLHHAAVQRMLLDLRPAEPFAAQRAREHRQSRPAEDLLVNVVGDREVESGPAEVRVVGPVAVVRLREDLVAPL